VTQLVKHSLRHLYIFLKSLKLLFFLLCAELRAEAVMQALAQNRQQPLIMPMSSKRTSAVVKPARARQADHATGSC